MKNLKIFVARAYGAERRSFIDCVSDILVNTVENPNRLPYKTATGTTLRTVAMDFGRTTLSNELNIYYFGNPGHSSAVTLLDILDQNHIAAQQNGFVLIIQSHQSGDDDEYKRILGMIQKQNRPYIIALTQSHPIKRSPESLRTLFQLPEDIRILEYDRNQPATAKQVVLELLAIMPQDDLVRQAIERLKAPIEET